MRGEPVVDHEGAVLVEIHGARPSRSSTRTAVAEGDCCASSRRRGCEQTPRLLAGPRHGVELLEDSFQKAPRDPPDGPWPADRRRRACQTRRETVPEPTLIPMPTTTTRCPVRRDSSRMPASFRPSTSTSLGHFSRAAHAGRALEGARHRHAGDQGQERPLRRREAGADQDRAEEAGAGLVAPRPAPAAPAGALGIGHHHGAVGGPGLGQRERDVLRRIDDAQTDDLGPTRDRAASGSDVIDPAPARLELLQPWRACSRQSRPLPLDDLRRGPLHELRLARASR